MRRPQRKRSAAITLVLAGGAALGGCGSPIEQRDAYYSLKDCVNDWNNAALCEPVRDGRYAQNYFYGPAYYGTQSETRWFRRDRIVASPNAVDAYRVDTGTVARSPASQLAMRTQAAGRGIERGGFGSTGRRISSSGS